MTSPRLALRVMSVCVLACSASVTRRLRVPRRGASLLGTRLPVVRALLHHRYAAPHCLTAGRRTRILPRSTAPGSAKSP